VERTQQVRNRFKWEAVVSTVMNLKFHKRWGILWLAERLNSFSAHFNNNNMHSYIINIIIMKVGQYGAPIL
jgi:hypothetical protein